MSKHTQPGAETRFTHWADTAVVDKLDNGIFPFMGDAAMLEHLFARREACFAIFALKS